MGKFPEVLADVIILQQNSSWGMASVVARFPANKSQTIPHVTRWLELKIRLSTSICKQYHLERADGPFLRLILEYSELSRPIL